MLCAVATSFSTWIRAQKRPPGHSTQSKVDLLHAIFTNMEISEGAYTLLGVGLGAALTQVATWVNMRQADKRNIKEALYSLLEFDYALTGLVRLNASLPLMVRLLKKQFPIAIPPQIEVELDKLLTSLLRDTFTPIFSQPLTELRESYHASLLKLAPIDPIGAYRLRGQADVMQRLPTMVQAMQAAGAKHLDMDSSKPPPPELMSFFQQHLEADEVLSTRTTVREVIQRFTYLLNWRTRRELADVLQHDTVLNEVEIDKMLGEYMGRLREAMPELFAQLR